ncbi:serine/threonine-protein kinase [Hyalangium gracile]|uniref:serine/threonine-protein kinase n=1 Tax=Hyalangium gracile TaxID=394092 RepID=UPI001CCB3469|nr:serine/threonine-protein kinase [Hyalangium gracile]
MAKEEAPEPVRPPSAMTEVGAWRLLELRSWGGYGTVYRAEPVGRPGAGPFALKLALQAMDARFLREAELLRRVRHAHVPRLYDTGWWEHPAGRFPYLVMEWFEGVSLYDWGRGRELSSRQVLRVLASAARALEATHAVEAVHRDVKGDNMLVRPEDSHLMLLDFGAGDFRGAPTLTREVLPPGTPGYRSPEALRFQERYWRTAGVRYEPGPADDLYALGVTAYRLVTGAYPPPPVPGEQVKEDPTIPTIGSEPPEKWATMSPELAGMIRQLLSEEPATRGSAGRVAEVMEEAVERSGPEADQPIRRRAQRVPGGRQSKCGSSGPGRERWSWLSVAAGLALTVGLTTALVLRGQRDTGEQAPPRLLEEEGPPGWEEGSADAGTSLATELLAVSVSEELPEPGWQGLGEEVPKDPLPGQARPPCKQRGAVVINKGCWGRPEVSTPPCGEGEYEWEGRCYRPLLGLPRPATSQPR